MNNPPTALVGFQKAVPRRSCRLNMNDPPTALVGFLASGVRAVALPFQHPARSKSVCGLNPKVHNRDAAAFLAFLPSRFFRLLPSAPFICSRSAVTVFNITVSILPLLPSAIHCIIDERKSSFK
jgi:hypothetical protein